MPEGKLLVGMSILVLIILTTIIYLPGNGIIGFATVEPENRITIQAGQTAKIDLGRYFENALLKNYLVTGATDLKTDTYEGVLSITPYPGFIGAQKIKIIAVGDVVEEQELLVDVAGFAEQTSQNIVPEEQADSGEIKEGDRIIGHKIEDEPGFDVFFEEINQGNEYLKLSFYHNSRKEEQIRIIGDVSFTATTKAAPNELVTVSILLADGIIPEFELHVGDDSEAFMFGKKLPKIRVDGMSHKYREGFNKFIDVQLFDGSSSITIKKVNASEIRGAILPPQTKNPELEITTNIIAISPANMSETTMILRKIGRVNTIAECPDFSFASNTCPAWQAAEIQFRENETHVEFTVKHFSAYAGALEILNVQSYPPLLGNWTVEFTTRGKEDLMIAPINGTSWAEFLNDNPSTYDDLQFIEVRCGNKIEKPLFIDETGREHNDLDGESIRITSVIFKNYKCDEKGTLKNKVLTAGKHTLEFKYGRSTRYAYNMVWAGKNDLANANASYDGQTSNDYFSRTIAIGDLDGDNIDDLVVGGMANAGSLYIWYGPVPIGSHLPATNADAIILGENAGEIAGDLLGSCLATGDANGDGYDDILVGASGYPAGSYVGRVYIIYGGPARLSGQYPIQIMANAYWDGTVATGFFCDIGDIHNDNFDEIFISSWGVDGFDDQGAVYLIDGKEAQYSGAYSLPIGQYTALFLGENDYDEASHVAWLGDVNGDGVGDFMIGAPGYFSGALDGRAYLFFGGAYSGTYSVASASQIWDVPLSGWQWQFGAMVAGAGDVDNDGINDILISAPYADYNEITDSGAVYLIYGSPLISGETIDATFYGYIDYYYLGDYWSVGGEPFPGLTLGSGNLNNDNYDDLLLGASTADMAVPDGGELNVVYGGAARFSGLYSVQTKDSGGSADASFYTESGLYPDHIGTVPRWSGDLNNDGYLDALIGASYRDTAPLTEEGAAYLVLGGAAPAGGNIKPTHAQPLLQSTFGTNTVNENLTVYNQSTYDADGDPVTNIINWYEDGESYTTLNLAFDSNISSLAAGAIRDYSSHINNGTLGAGYASWAPSWTSAGISGGAYVHDGLDDQILVVDSDSVSLSEPIALEAWINARPDNDYKNLFEKQNEYLFRIDNLGEGSRLSCFIVLNSSYEPRVSSTTAFPTGSWHHVVCVWDGATARLYIDGVLNNSISRTGTVATTSYNLSIGRTFNGTIDEVRIYKQNLSAEQIQANYLSTSGNYADTIVSQETSLGEVWHAEMTPNDGQPNTDGNSIMSNGIQVGNEPTHDDPMLQSTPAGLFGDNEDLYVTPMNVQDLDNDTVINITNWFVNNAPIAVLNMPFEGLIKKHLVGDASTVLLMYFENNTVDFSGNGNNGTLNGPTYNSSGKVGGAYDYDGTNDYIQISDANSLEIINSQITISYWVRGTFNYSSSGGIVLEKGGWNSGEYGMTFYMSNKPRFQIFEGSPNNLLDATTDVNDGRWHHVVGTWDGNVMSIYVDGVLENSVSNTGGFTPDSEDLYIGSRTGTTDFFNGTIDEVTIWNRTLTDKEVFKIYSRGINSSEETLDYSSYGNDGTLNNGVANATGILGDAYSFDGSNDYIEVPYDSTLNVTGNLTLEAWVNPSRNITAGFTNSAQGYESIIHKTFAFYSIQFDNSTGKLQFTLNNGSYNNCPSTKSFWNANQWYHIVGTYNSSAMEVYIDGSLDATCTGALGTLNSNNGAVYIGSGDNGNVRHFGGAIDEVKIYYTALTAGQVRENYKLGAPKYDIIDNTTTTNGEMWKVCMTPNDGIENGLTKCSPDFNIQGNVEVSCTNCIDDDNDTLVDCKDNDCWGNVNCQELTSIINAASDNINIDSTGAVYAEAQKPGGSALMCGPGTIVASSCNGAIPNPTTVQDIDFVGVYVGGVDMSYIDVLELDAAGGAWCVVRYNIPSNCTRMPIGPGIAGLVGGPAGGGIYSWASGITPLSLADLQFPSGNVPQEYTLVLDGNIIVDAGGTVPASAGIPGTAYAINMLTCPMSPGLVGDRMEATSGSNPAYLVFGQLNLGDALWIIDSVFSQLVEITNPSLWPVGGPANCLQVTPAPAMMPPWRELRQTNNQNTEPLYMILMGGNRFPRNWNDMKLVDSGGNVMWISAATPPTPPAANTMLPIMPPVIAGTGFGNQRDAVNPFSHPGGVWTTAVTFDPTGQLTGDFDSDGLTPGTVGLITGELVYGSNLTNVDSDAGGVPDGTEDTLGLNPINANDDICGAGGLSIQTTQPNIDILNFQLDFQATNGTFETLNGTCANCSFDQQNTCQLEQEEISGTGPINMTLTLTGNPINMTNMQLICTMYSYATNILGGSNCTGSNNTNYSCANFTGGGNMFVLNLTNSSYFNTPILIGSISPDSNCSTVVCYLNGTWNIGDEQNFSINKSFTISDGTSNATNPNGTLTFSTNKDIEIKTFSPDIEIHNFNLDFQALNGTFDTTTGTCFNCEFDLDNGTCQAEIEKIWAMFPTVNVSMTLSTSSPLNMTAFNLVCRIFTSSLWPSSCSALSPHGFGANNWMNWTSSTISTVLPSNGGVVINLTGSNVYPNITIPLGTASINNTVQQIGCEVNGTWAIGDIQNFTINKTMTITAN